MTLWSLVLLIALQGDTLTYTQAVQWFLQQNPDLRIGQYQTEIARVSWWQSLVRLIPSPVLNASYSSQTRPFLPSLPPDLIGQPEEAYSIAFSIEQVLFSPQLWSQALDQRLGLLQTQWSYRNLQNTLWVAFRKAYFETYESQEETRLRTLSLKRAREALVLVKRKLQLGQAVKLDLLQAQLAVQKALQDSIQRMQTFLSRKHTLAALLGKTRLRASVLQPPEVTPDSSLVDSLIRHAQDLLEQHPEIQKQSLEVRASKIAFWAAVLSWLPTVKYGVYWNYYKNDFPTWRRFWEESRYVKGIYVSLSFPFFTYPLDALLSHKNRSLQVETLRKVRLQKRVALQQALSAYETARKSLKIAELSVEMAQEAFKLSKNQYELGALSILDLLKAQEELTQAEIQFLKTQIQWWIALDQLKLALGEAFSW